MHKALVHLTVILCAIIAFSAPIDANMATDAVAEINQIRKKSGKKSLTANTDLMAAAQKHAEELADRGYGSKFTSGGHFGANGSKFNERIKREGYKSCTAVENIAWGQKSAQAVVAGWMTSKGHKKNLLNRKISEIGIGFAPPKTWVMVGARPC